jgi:hypothetical protein
MGLFSRFSPPPSFSSDLSNTPIRTLDPAKGALFFLMKPFLAFRLPENKRVDAFDYQSNLALFEMSFVMLVRVEHKALHVDRLRDSWWPQILRSHIDTFRHYLNLNEADFDALWNDRRNAHAALWTTLSFADYTKAFSWILHETLSAGKPSLGVHGMVETMLFGETDKGVRICFVPPLEHEFGAFAIDKIYDGPLSDSMDCFVTEARQGSLEMFLKRYA